MSAPLDTAAVWKWPVPAPTVTGRSSVDIPVGTVLLSAGVDAADRLVVWGFVPDPHAENGTRQFLVVNTGAALPSFLSRAGFLGTVTTSTGVVWHVWQAWDGAYS